MAERPFIDFYDHIFKLLSSDAEVTAIVTDSENIRPSNDVVEPKEGPVIFYSWTASQWVRRRQRGSGTLNLTIAHPSNKTQALELLELVRRKLTPRALTDAFNKVIVHKFDENPALSDEAEGPTFEFEASTSFDARLTEVQP